MKDAETGQRGYLLTGRKQFLEPYNGSPQLALQQIDEAQKLTRDNAEQQVNMAAIKQIIIQRLGILEATIDKRTKGQAVTVADLDAGKAAMDALRRAVDKAENEEHHLLDERSANLKKYSALTPAIFTGAIALAIVIAIISYLQVMRDVNEKDRLRAELEIKEQETAAFNEELTAANEEITASNEELTAINEELAEARWDLAQINESLEAKVAARTKELADSEEETQALNEELTAMNEELAATNEELITTNEELAESEHRLQEYVDQLRITQHELERNEELFRTIARNIPGSLIVVIGLDRRFMAVEGDLMVKMGYNSVDYRGKHPAEVNAERYEATKDLYDRMFQGEQFRMERRGADHTDYQVDFVPLRNEADEIYAGLVIALDITDRKKAEERSAKLAAIVESSDDAIIGKTLEGIITSWNRGAEQMFGYKESDMIGQSVMTLIPQDRQDEEPVIISKLKNGESVDHFETLRITREGKLIDVSLTISPIRDAAGTIIGVSKIARDISEQKRDEQRKNDFIGMASHELKTPLTSLSALIQVLDMKLSNNPDSFVPSALGKANTQVKKMTGMINGFLNISRLESGKLQVDRHIFDLAALIQEMIAEAELTVSSHTFQFDTPEALEISADRDKIGSVISNLISNAVKYSPRGKTITINHQTTAGSVVVNVSDEGIGIEQHHLGKLFDRYYRVKSDHTQHISGFGIGLYLSAEIIQRHGGRIWADSEVGLGSTFHFSLPLTKS
jgi:PAS domain S-box-containing protein